VLYLECFAHHAIHHTEEELIVNVDAVTRDKFPVAVGDIIEISVPNEAAYKYVCVHVAPHPSTPLPPTPGCEGLYIGT
jgi:hypothetical protein